MSYHLGRPMSVRNFCSSYVLTRWKLWKALHSIWLSVVCTSNSFSLTSSLQGLNVLTSAIKS